MKLRRYAAREYKEPAIVPLVNVVFLLLIFFMLVGRLTVPQPLDVDAPVSMTGGPTDNRRTVFILISADGRMALEDKEMEQDLLLSAVAKLMDEDPTLEVKVKADARLDAVRLIRLMEFLREAGVGRLTLLAERSRS